MIVGILKEIKVLEKRVCMTPAGVVAMKQNGHDVMIEKNAGFSAGNEVSKKLNNIDITCFFIVQSPQNRPTGNPNKF